MSKGRKAGNKKFIPNISPPLPFALLNILASAPYYILQYNKQQQQCWRNLCKGKTGKQNVFNKEGNKTRQAVKKKERRWGKWAYIKKEKKGNNKGQGKERSWKKSM